MHNTLLAAAIALALAPAASPGGAPRLVAKKGRHVVILPKAMARSVQRAYPAVVFATDSEFPADVRSEYARTPRKAPQAVVADFNGDGRPDLAFIGRVGQRYGVYAIVSAGKSYRTRRLASQETVYPYSELYLEAIPPGRYDDPHDGSIHRLAHPGIKVHHYESDSWIIYFREGRFEECCGV